MLPEVRVHSILAFLFRIRGFRRGISVIPASIAPSLFLFTVVVCNCRYRPVRGIRGFVSMLCLRIILDLVVGCHARFNVLIRSGPSPEGNVKVYTNQRKINIYRRNYENKKKNEKGATTAGRSIFTHTHSITLSTLLSLLSTSIELVFEPE